ncbi:DUF3987 domain-containing protein [Roseovarius gahaiensis]|uniref:DUF3987 domain-containing protein n=1 Tax=Roseovarius gahaiensis TaxID=2716691 RepID=A0A967BA59_9RHOB|nr:DUF3987 domain-containing protein [Roseovarius gahaiensis]NHQ74197.1 DUF3987 domain-containing protein [Roseovarius gahaiensis]
MSAQGSTNRDLALALARAGFPVFPCLEADGLAHDKGGMPKRAKAPYTPRGFHDATTDANTVAAWWAQWPGAVPGIPTGDASGLAVIDGDINRETGEPEGESEIAALGLDLPGAVRVRTQSGGVQLLYRHAEGARTSSKQAAPHIDTRGAGGYIVAPGARMQNAASYRYESRNLAAALRAGDLPPYPVEVVEAAIAARKAKASTTGDDGESFIIHTAADRTEATDAETIEVVGALLAEASNDLCREDWVKLAFSLRAAYGDTLRDDFINFSLGYVGRNPCTVEAARHVWTSAGKAKKVTGIGPALRLLKQAVGPDRFTAAWHETFNRTRGSASVGKVGKVGTKAPEPTPLIREMPESAPFPVAALGPLRDPAEAIARATEAPVAMCAASVLASAALAAQGHRDAETLNGTAPASLFLLTVAESGERKSTADRLAMRGVRDFEADLRTDYDIQRDHWRDQHEVWKATRAKIVGEKKADSAAKRADLQALGPEPPAPLKPHIVASAPTIEGITKHLPELRASLGIMTEEGGALIGGHSMKAENKLATCASFSAMWDGSPLDRWRAGDGVESYTGRRFSAHILVQPVAAEALLSDPMANGQGLLARFLTCRPASRIGTRLRMEKDAAAEAEIASFAARVRSLLSRDLPLADHKRNELAPPILPMSREARDVLTAFAREVEKAQAPGGPFEDARAFASKTAEHAARLSAVLTIYADSDAAQVTGETMAGAIEVATFYANEAARLADAAIVPPEVADAERMRLWLLGSWGEPHISARAAAQRGPFKVTDRARKALRKLEAHGWLIEANGAEVECRPRREAWRIVREVQP